MFLECGADLDRALHRRRWRGEEHQRHAIAGRQAPQFARFVGAPEFRAGANALVQRLEKFALLVIQQPRVADMSTNNTCASSSCELVSGHTVIDA